MELYRNRRFAAVAKYENMTRRREPERVAQPRCIKTAESGKRRGRVISGEREGYRRTEQGDILLRYARTILEAERDARGEIEESLHRTGGLCICALSCAERISEILAGFSAEPAVWICASAVRPRAATCCSDYIILGTNFQQAPSCNTMRRWLCRGTPVCRSGKRIADRTC